jgi:cell division protein FtsQ
MGDRGAKQGAAWLLGVVLVGVTGWLVLNSPIFAVRQIRLFGNVALTRDEVLDLAGVEDGDSLFRVSSEEVERLVRRSPWVVAVEVDREWPSTLTLRITERRPVALAEGPSGTFMVAGDGTVLGRLAGYLESAPILTELPYVTRTEEILGQGDPYPGPPPVLRVAASFPPQLRRAVRRVGVDDGAIVLELRAGGTVLYGDAGATGAKNTAVLAVLDEAGRQGIDVGYIDVRIPSSPTLKPAAQSPAPWG